MKDKDWIEQLQSKMEGHQEPVPGGLWQDIEKRLPEREAERHPLMGGWRRYAAAAALVAAVIGIGSLMWNDDSTVEEPAITSAQPVEIAPDPEATHELLAQDEEVARDIDEPTATPRAHHSIPASKVATTASDNAFIAQASGHEQEEQPAQAASETSPAETPIEQAPQPMEQRNQTHAKEPSTTTMPHQSILPKFKKTGITVGLYASNSVKPDWSSGKDYAYAYASDAIHLPNGDNPYGTYYSEDIYSANHHAPISMGLSVRLPLTDRLALTSGLVYTRLKSDFTSSRRYREQTLHYLGIPLGVTYNVWGYKRFNLYAVGGVQADVNVKATLKESGQANSLSIGKDRVQFSALAGPGVQLDLSRDFGIYVEPTARYYFNNGSNVANYYKDKPWNINFNAGLRLSLQ